MVTKGAIQREEKANEFEEAFLGLNGQVGEILWLSGRCKCRLEMCELQ
jgi:hypothetical protein